MALYATTRRPHWFLSLSRTTLGASSALGLLGAFSLMLVTMLVISSSASRYLSPSSRRGVIATSLFVNGVNLMLPVTLFALGQTGVERAPILYVVTTVLLYLVCPIIFARRTAW